MSNSNFISEVSICNQALGWIGADPITSLNDENTTAELCRLNYPHLRDTVLEERQWTFAVLRHTSITADEPEFGAGFSHPIPIEYLRVSRVYNDVTSFNIDRWRTSSGWRREGDKIIALEDQIHMWGTEQVTDTSRFSIMFVQALAARIAADLCIPIANNLPLQVKMYQIYLAKLKDAAASDGAQGSNEVVQANKLIDARARFFDGGFSNG